MEMTATPARSQGVRVAERVVDAGQRRSEIAIATLFLLTAAAAIGAVLLLDPILSAPDYLGKVFPNKTVIVLGSVMWSINNIGIVFIAVFAYPLLRKADEVAAVGYLAARIIEGAVMMFGVAATLLLIPLSEQFIKAGAQPGSSLLAGDVLKHMKVLGLSELSLPLLGLGGLIFVWQLFRYRLVPRFISSVGLIGYALVFLGGFAGWFGLVDVAPFGSATVLAGPVAVFEIVLLPFWLLLKGFTIRELPQSSPEGRP
jgi:hypothetical protein